MFLKRILDLIVSSMALVLLSPLYLLFAITIRLTCGSPVLFRQPRLGKDGVPFDIYKFRTMQVGAPDIRNPDGSTYSSEDDPRVTPVGVFLRKTSLDELPQLINVVKGDMSLVGPRPEVTDVLDDYEEGEIRRLSMKPGVTGWAVVHGRNSVPLYKRRQFDIEYVDNWSFWLDIKILIITVPVVLFSRDVFTPDNIIQDNDWAK